MVSLRENPNTVTHSSQSPFPSVAGGSVLAVAVAGVTGDGASAAMVVAGGGGVQGLEGAGSASISFRGGGSTTPSMGEPGAEARERSHEGERLPAPAARGEGEPATGRRSEAVGSGEKSAAAKRSSSVKRGGGGGVAEGVALAPEGAKREPPARWDGMGEARSRKKGDWRAARPPRREAAGEREEEAM